MSGDFLPQYKAVPTSTGWRPSYRLFVGEKEKVVPGSPVFPSVAEAVQAAMDYVRVKLNPPILSYAVKPDADELIRQEWREQKVREAEEERVKVFGAHGPQTVFSRHGKPVTVERRRHRV